MTSTSHTHQLSDGQLICDNEQCREKVLERIEEIKIDFDEIVHQNCQDEKINQTQAWKIINLTSRKLSDRLTLLLNKEEIGEVIEKFLKQKKTKQAFEKAFNYEKTRQSVTKEQLWNIYMNMSKEAVQILSKTKRERGKYIVNFLVSDEN